MSMIYELKAASDGFRYVLMGGGGGEESKELTRFWE